MRRQNGQEFRSRYVQVFRAIGLAFIGILLAASSGHAGVLTATWVAPTTNTDGSQLTELALYRLYYDTSDAPCPAGNFVEVASPTSAPQPNDMVSFQLTGLMTGSIYSVSVTAVNAEGYESACSDVASAIAPEDSAATPVQDTTTVQENSATTPVQDTTTPTVPENSATTPNSFCPPGQTRKGRC